MFRLISCGTTPMEALAASRSVSRSYPNTWTEPPDFRISDVMMPIVVVLPAPFGPSSAKKSPSRTVRSMPFSASTPLPYTLRRSLMTNASMVVLAGARAPRAAIVNAQRPTCRSGAAGRVLRGGMRGPSLRPVVSKPRLQRDERELPPRLGPRIGQNSVPQHMLAGERAMHDVRRCGQPLEVGQRERPQQLDLGNAEAEQKLRLIRTLSAGLAFGPENRQRELVIPTIALTDRGRLLPDSDDAVASDLKQRARKPC